MMEPGHFYACRLYSDISLTELLSSLILFDASGCNELRLQRLSLGTFSSQDFHLNLNVCIMDYIRSENFIWKWDTALLYCFRTTPKASQTSSA